MLAPFDRKLELLVAPNTEMPGIELLPSKNRFKALKPVMIPGPG